MTCKTQVSRGGISSPLIDCQGRGACEHSSKTDYPMCICEAQYEGYNCGSETDITADGPGKTLLIFYTAVSAWSCWYGEAITPD